MRVRGGAARAMNNQNERRIFGGGGIMQNSATERWETGYEWKAVTLLGLGFGLVGLDRWIIAPLFPAIAADLGLA
jgi:hypothetical protein